MTNEDKFSVSQESRHVGKDKHLPVKRLQSQSQMDHVSKSHSHQNTQLETHSEISNDTSSNSQSNEDEITWRLKKLNSSAPFEKIMADIEDKMVEQFKKQQELTKKSSKDETESVIEKPVILLELEDDEEEEEARRLELEKAKNTPARKKARRAWALIRRHIREEAMSKKQNKSTFQWSMLQQTIKNMTNKDAARTDLYNKYLNPSNPRLWTDGIKSIPPGFFAKHSKEVMKKPTPPHGQTLRRAKSAVSHQKSTRSMRSYKL